MEDYIDFRIAEKKKGQDSGHEQLDRNFNAVMAAEGAGLDTEGLKK
jgi:hypothetical protein